MGYTDMSSVSKIADPVQTALGDHDWNAGATKAERVVRHLAKPVDPTDLTKGNIYEEFFSGDFGSAGRWMITNLTAFYYDPDRTSVDQDVLVLNNITSYPSVETTIGWMYPGPGAATDATSLNSNPFLGLLYTQAAATNNMPSRKYDNPGTENQNLTWMEFGTGPDQVQRIQGVCPAGWHVPSHLEFVLLIKEILRNTSMYANHSDINPSESTARNVTTDLFPILDPKSSPVSSIKNSIALNVCSDVCYDGDVFGPPLSRSILDGGLSFSFSGIRGAEGAHTPDHQMYAIAGATTRKSEMIQMNNVNQERDWIQIQGLSWAFSVRCVKDLQ
jgi:hypothetical protein